MNLSNLTVIITDTIVKLYNGNLSKLASSSIIDEEGLTRLSFSGYEFFIVTDKNMQNYMQFFCENFSFEECREVLVLEQHKTLEDYLKDPLYTGLFK